MDALIASYGDTTAGGENISRIHLCPSSTSSLTSRLPKFSRFDVLPLKDLWTTCRAPPNAANRGEAPPATVKKRLGLSFGSGWPYFDFMERLKQGPMPISARRPYQDDDDKEEDEADDGDDEIDEDEEENDRKLQSLDCILRRPAIVNRFSGTKQWHFRDSASAKRPREAVDDDGYDGDMVEGDVVDGQRGTEMVAELAKEIRAFAKRLIGVENMRMEITRDTERYILDMENRRMDMILESQQKIVDSIDRACGLY